MSWYFHDVLVASVHCELWVLGLGFQFPGSPWLSIDLLMALVESGLFFELEFFKLWSTHARFACPGLFRWGLLHSPPRMLTLCLFFISVDDVVCCVWWRWLVVVKVSGLGVICERCSEFAVDQRGVVTRYAPAVGFFRFARRAVGHCCHVGVQHTVMCHLAGMLVGHESGVWCAGCDEF